MSTTGSEPPAAANTPDPDPFAEALVTLVREQLRTERDDEAYEAVRRQAAQLRRTMAALHSVPLRNADEPHLIFRPLRGEE